MGALKLMSYFLFRTRCLSIRLSVMAADYVCPFWDQILQNIWQVSYSIFITRTHTHTHTHTHAHTQHTHTHTENPSRPFNVQGQHPARKLLYFYDTHTCTHAHAHTHTHTKKIQDLLLMSKDSILQVSCSVFITHTHTHTHTLPLVRCCGLDWACVVSAR